MNTWVTIASCVAGLIFWYFIYGLNCALNSGQLGRHWFFFPFQCFWDEIKWNFPGGKAHYIKINIVGSFEDGSVCGSKRTWSFREIRERNLYAECGKDVLPGIPTLLFEILLPFGIGFLFCYGVRTFYQWVITLF